MTELHLALPNDMLPGLPAPMAHATTTSGTLSFVIDNADS